MRSRDIVVDSRFFVPNNIVDIRFKQEDDIENVFGVSEPDAGNTGIPATGVEPVADLPTPNITFDIISQTIKSAPDGTQTVDVIIELPDVDGALYDMRITRVV